MLTVNPPVPDAVICVSVTPVTLPNWSTVKTGIKEPLPYVATVTPELAIPIVTSPAEVAAVICAVLDTLTILASVYIVEIFDPFHEPVCTVPKLEYVALILPATTLPDTVILDNEVLTTALIALVLLKYNPVPSVTLEVFRSAILALSAKFAVVA